MGRYAVIGDVHGCIREFEKLLDLLRLDPAKDVGISLGDLVDRGPNSGACVALAMKSGLHLVGSNHDYRLVRWKAAEQLVEAGVNKTNEVRLREQHRVSVDSVNAHPDAAGLWQYLQNYRPTFAFSVRGREYNCVHAGYDPRYGAVSDQEWLFKIREVDVRNGRPLRSKDAEGNRDAGFWAEVWKGPQRVVFGHTVYEKPAEFPHAIGIDTGACFGGSLTALVIEPDGTERLVSVKSESVYYRRDGE